MTNDVEHFFMGLLVIRELPLRSVCSNLLPILLSLLIFRVPWKFWDDKQPARLNNDLDTCKDFAQEITCESIGWARNQARLFRRYSDIWSPQQWELKRVGTELRFGADFKPEFCGKPRRHSHHMKHAPSPRAPGPLVRSVCPVRCLYGVPCKPSFELFCVSLSLASWNLWLLVHYRGSSSSKVGTTSLQAVNTRQLASQVPDYRIYEGHLHGHAD